MAARWVVGHENGSHVLYEDGEVVFEGDRIVFVGHDFPGEVARRVECGHALLGPGFNDLDALSDLDTTVLARYDTLFTQDGHRNGSIAVARELGLLGPFALLSHSVDLTPADFAALTGTGAHIVHNPSAIMSIYGRCPAPELIEKGVGVTVCFGSDAGAPDRGKEFRPGEIRRMGTRYSTQLRQWRRGSAARPGR